MYQCFRCKTLFSRVHSPATKVHWSWKLEQVPEQEHKFGSQIPSFLLPLLLLDCGSPLTNLSILQKGNRGSRSLFLRSIRLLCLIGFIIFFLAKQIRSQQQVTRYKKSKKSAPLIKAISYLNKELQEAAMVPAQDLTYMRTL